MTYWSCEVHQRMSKRRLRCQWQWLNKCIKESIIQWTLNQWINETPNESVNQQIGKSVIRWFTKSINRWICESMNAWVCESMNQCSNDSVNTWHESTNQWAADSVKQNVSVNHRDPPSQWIMRSMNQWINDRRLAWSGVEQSGAERSGAEWRWSNVRAALLGTIATVSCTSCRTHLPARNASVL